MIEHLNNNLFLITANLAQINNRELLIKLFVESLNDIFDKVRFEWHESDVLNFSLLLSVGGNKYGFICFNNKLDDLEFILLSNAVQMVAIFIDRLNQIEMLKKHEELKLMEEQQFTTNILNSLTDTFCLFDPDNGKTIKWNYKLEKKTGYSASEISKMKVPDDFFSNEDVEKIKILFQEVEKQGSASIELNMICKDGSTIPTEYVVTALNYKFDNRKHYIFIGRNVTKRNATLKALVDSETKLRNIIEHSNEVYYIHDLNNVLTYISPQSKLLLGYEPEEMMRKWTDIVSNNPINEIGIQHTLKALTTGESQPLYSLELVKKDGTNVFVEVDESPLKNDLGIVVNMVGALRDITEKKYAEKKIKHSNDRLNLSLEANNASIFENRLDVGTSIYSPHLFKYLDYNHDEIPTTIEAYNKLVHPDDLHIIDEALEYFFRGNTPYYYCQYRIKAKNGDWNWISSQGKIFSFDDAGNPKVLVGISQDIHFNKVAELAILNQNDEIAMQNEEYIVLNDELQQSLLEIKNMNIDLLKAREKAEESDRLKSAFLANMSHEIRTPLNSILGFSSLIADKNISNDDKHNFAQLIEKSGIHLTRIIDDVIDISKIESNQLYIFKEKVKLSTLFDEVVKIFEIESEIRDKKHIELKCIRPRKIHQIELTTDYVRLRQVFINLLTNSYKFTNNGYIEFGVRKIGKKNIEFYVKDTGIGIEKGIQEIIFERFMQAKSKSLNEGTGLGLSITKGVVELLGGKIWVDSEVNKGSTFRFILPIN